MLRQVVRKIRMAEMRPVYFTKRLRESYSTASVCKGTLRNKNVLITGGGSGIGLAIAKRMLMEGCYVVITGRNEKKLTEAIESITFGKNKIAYVVCDQEKVKEMNKKLTQILALFPEKRIDVLINNAGVFTEVDRTRAFRNVEKEYNKILGINLKGTYALTTKIIEVMIHQQVKGSIVNIASICAISPKFMYTPYGISKSGVIAMTKELSQKYKKNGITINAVAPGSVATAMGDLKENDNLAKKNNILRRVILPEEVAGLVAMLASEYGRYLGGRVITISAGEVL